MEALKQTPTAAQPGHVWVVEFITIKIEIIHNRSFTNPAFTAKTLQLWPEWLQRQQNLDVKMQQ